MTTQLDSRPPERPTARASRASRLLKSFNAASSLVVVLLAIVTALIVGVFVIAISDYQALARGDVLGVLNRAGLAYRAIPEGAFGSWSGISEVITRTTPLIFTGLALALAFRANLFNIGANGQFMGGALVAVLIAFSVDAPAVVLIPLALVGAILGGGLVGAIPGVLKARTGAHEVIVTIMLNYVVALGALWLLQSDLFVRVGRTDPVSKPIHESAELPRIFGVIGLTRDEARAHVGFFLAILAVLLVWWLLTKTKFGFEIRSVGANVHAARYAGMSAGTVTVVTFLISGALAGLAGGVEVLGTSHEATPSLAGEIGFDAIAVALLGRSTPLGVVGAAFLFGTLQASQRAVQLEAGVSLDLIYVLRALIVLFIAAQALTQAIWRIDKRSANALPGVEATA